MAVEHISSKILTQLSFEASILPRRRKHLNIHKNYNDACQMLFNAISTESYIRPHRHLIDNKDECLIAVRGLFALIIFDHVGHIINIKKFGSESFQKELDVDSGALINKRVWHTVIALISGSVLFEVKEGPFSESSAKEFALWSPGEETEDAKIYLEWMQSITKKNYDNLIELSQK